MRTNTLRVLATWSVLATGVATGGSPVDALPQRTGEPPVAAPRIAECRIGFDGHFKVGFWTPLWVAVAGDVAERPLTVEATTIDSDGVRVSVRARLESGGDSVNGVGRVLLHTKIGRIGAPLEVTLLGEDAAILDRVELSPSGRGENAAAYRPLSATSELIVHLGKSAVGLEEAIGQLDNDTGVRGRTLVRLLDVDALPTAWFGYEAADIVVLTTGDAALMRRLAGDRRRFAALQQWLELGGRIVVLCGGEAAGELLAEGGALAAFAPGELRGMVPLPETVPLEHFAKSGVPVAPGGSRPRLIVPQLARVEGSIEVYAGRQPSDLPLVVRSAHGLGEAVFVGIDFSEPPLDEWVGRRPFLQAVLEPYLAPGDESAGAPSLIARGYNDLSGALRQALGRSFSGVAPIGFSTVIVLALAYLLALGPVDYLVVHRWLRRPWVAWVSFSIIVLLFGIAALAIADWRRAGGGARVNRLEVIDIDTLAGRARGTFWAALYSPRAEQLDVALDVRTAAGVAQSEAEKLLSWWGLPGVGIGGMQAGGAELGLVRDGYSIGPQLETLVNMPVLSSSTKSLMARWTAPMAALVEVRLTDDDGLLRGSIESRLDKPLHNLRLLYNGWAYRLGTLEAGGRIEVGEEMSPRRLKTVVTQDALGPLPPNEADGKMFVAQRATAKQILNLMMFYEAAGGYGFAQLADDYQGDCDLSRLLELGRAILVADLPDGGSRLVRAGGDEALGDEGGQATVVYRFVLPVSGR